MNIAPPSVQTHTSLTLLTPSGEPLDVQKVSLKLIQDQEVLNECHLSFSISLDLYRRITTDTLFHLKPELLSPTSKGDFQLGSAIEITTALRPQLLSSLPQQATEPSAIIDYLAKLSQSLSDQTIESKEHPPSENLTTTAAAPASPSPQLQTESRFDLHIKQQQPSTEITYRTFWSYLSPTLLAKEVSSNGQISATMGHLFQDLAKQDEATAETAISAALDDLLQGLESWVEDQLSSSEDVFSTLADEISQAFDTWLDADSPPDHTPSPSKQPIYRAMVTFFTDDDWAFTKLKGESTLQLGFETEHGQWTCYAVARDNEAQFLFYSVYPTTVPERQRLTRVNYGLVQGNFEFDFDRGEIRYKTSLDITHMSINPKAIQQLVYTNVTIMGHYLPGILAVLEQGTSAKEAIERLEA